MRSGVGRVEDMKSGAMGVGWIRSGFPPISRVRREGLEPPTAVITIEPLPKPPTNLRRNKKEEEEAASPATV